MAEKRYPDPETHEYASPPCFAHELSPEYGGHPEPGESWGEILRWRKTERQRLIEERLAVDVDERKARSDRIASRLDLAVGKVSGRIVSGYWPFRGEPDLRNWAIKIIERGVWNILVPSRGPSVMPDIVIAPVVGFDGANYRLGYGGGFFDRTLAAMHRRPLAVGVGCAGSRLRTIHPQPHDIPMDVIVTDA